MSDGIRGRTLLPFLERGAGPFRLRFPLASDDPEVLANSSFPFLLVSDSDPTARIVAARVETDGGDRIASLFFLVQKDRYRLGKETLHPVTNVGVEAAWQRAGAAFRNFPEGTAPRFFEGPSDPGGVLSPFAPLFFCKEKGRYFHPPCPRCGRPLALCADDAVLAAARLPLYSRSIERHLFCEACAGSGGATFYAVEAGSGAPAALRDRISLVRDFGRLGETPSGETGFPCPVCPERGECFGPSLKALSRIVPFSFYPFHAFAFDAMSLCVPDFLALLSGANAETLARRLESAGEPGRAALVRTAGDADALLFERGERRFLEILYLKLSLLGQLLDALPPRGIPADAPEFLPSMDHAWVALGAARNLLPRYWNFRAGFLGIGRHGEEEEFPSTAPRSGDLVFLGTAWFDALLVNAHQDGAAVRRALSERMREPPPDASPFPGARDPGSPFFAGNLFFEPAADGLSDDAVLLWETALSAGGSILLAGRGGKPGAARETVAQEIRDLLARVRDRLFASARSSAVPERRAQAIPPAGPAAATRLPVSMAADADDAAIAGILDGILRKWGGGTAAGTAPPSPETKATPQRRPSAPQGADDFMVKTVLLGAPPVSASPAAFPPAAAGPAPDDTIEKTLILRPGGAPSADRPPAGPSSPPSPGDGIEKTLILRPGNGVPSPPRTGAPPSHPPPSSPPVDPLDKTVILGPGKSGVVPPAPERQKAPEPPPAAAPEGEFDLEKTVILKPPPGTGKPRRGGR